MAYTKDNRTSYSNRNLKGKDFSNTKFLDYVDFSNSDLTGANFSESILKKANFTGANLIDVDFTGSDIRGSDFKDALLLDEGVFKNIHYKRRAVRSLKNLDTVKYIGDMSEEELNNIDPDFASVELERRRLEEEKDREYRKVLEEKLKRERLEEEEKKKQEELKKKEERRKKVDYFKKKINKDKLEKDDFKDLFQDYLSLIEEESSEEVEAYKNILIEKGILYIVSEITVDSRWWRFLEDTKYAELSALLKLMFSFAEGKTIDQLNTLKEKLESYESYISTAKRWKLNAENYYRKIKKWKDISNRGVEEFELAEDEDRDKFIEGKIFEISESLMSQEISDHELEDLGDKVRGLKKLDSSKKFKKHLDYLEGNISERYSWLLQVKNFGLKDLKRYIGLRTASLMLKELQSEIDSLKKDL